MNAFLYFMLVLTSGSISPRALGSVRKRITYCTFMSFVRPMVDMSDSPSRQANYQKYFPDFEWQCAGG